MVGGFQLLLPLRTDKSPMYQLLAKSNYVWRLKRECAKLHQIWPEHFNTIGQCVAELRVILSIFPV